jgi:hypothetical protein
LRRLLQIELPGTLPGDDPPNQSRDADVLRRIRIASPCDASWEEMEGDDLVRHCRHCQKNVYNLSGMSRRDAAAFVREAQERHCIRFRRRRDGTFLTDDCPVGWRAARRRVLCGIAAGAAIWAAVLRRDHLAVPIWYDAPDQHVMGMFSPGPSHLTPGETPLAPALHLGGLLVAFLALLRWRKPKRKVDQAANESSAVTSTTTFCERE